MGDILDLSERDWRGEIPPRDMLVNAQGQLVGIVSTSIDDLPFLAATGAVPQNINYAVKADYARPLFEEPAPRPAAASRVEAYERATA